MLLPFATDIPGTDDALARLLTPDVLGGIVDLVPEEWLEEAGFTDAAEVRSAYLEFLLSRLEEPRRWVRALEKNAWVSRSSMPS